MLWTGRKMCCAATSEAGSTRSPTQPRRDLVLVGHCPQGGVVNAGGPLIASCQFSAIPGGQPALLPRSGASLWWGTATSSTATSAYPSHHCIHAPSHPSHARLYWAERESAEAPHCWLLLAVSIFAHGHFPVDHGASFLVESSSLCLPGPEILSRTTPPVCRVCEAWVCCVMEFSAWPADEHGRPLSRRPSCQWGCKRSVWFVSMKQKVPPLGSLEPDLGSHHQACLSTVCPDHREAFQRCLPRQYHLLGFLRLASCRPSPGCRIQARGSWEKHPLGSLWWWCVCAAWLSAQPHGTSCPLAPLSRHDGNHPWTSARSGLSTAHAPRVSAKA